MLVSNRSSYKKKLAPIERFMCFFFFKLQGLRSEAAKRLEAISSKLEEIKHKKRVTTDVVDEAERRNDEIKELLRSNENYRQISHLEDKLMDFMEENETLQETFDQLRKVCLCLVTQAFSALFTP